MLIKNQFTNIFILFYFSLFFINNCLAHFPNYGYDNKIRIWQPLMTETVEERLNDFLYSNNITNCYEFQEEDNHFLLKCWTNKDLVDVSILIKNQMRILSIAPGPTTNIVHC